MNMPTHVIQARNLERNTLDTGREASNGKQAAILAYGVSLVLELARANNGGRILHAIDVLSKIIEALDANSESISIDPMKNSVVS
jgi:hypothetical protein